MIMYVTIHDNHHSHLKSAIRSFLETGTCRVRQKTQLKYVVTYFRCVYLMSLRFETFCLPIFADSSRTAYQKHHQLYLTETS